MSQESLTVKLSVLASRHFSHSRRVLPYQRIASLENQFGQRIDLLEVETAAEETEIVLPELSAARLMGAGALMAGGASFNCHRFARMMAGLEPFNPAQRHAPPAEDFTTRPKVNNLPAGAIGLVGARGFGVMHSLVGLGKEYPASLQVISGEGQLGITDNSEMLSWYRAICEDPEVYIHQL